MTIRLFATVAVAAAVGIIEMGADQPPVRPSRLASVAPKVIAAERHDRSRALREVTAALEPTGEKFLERNPRWRRVSRHPAGLLPDPIVQDLPAVPAMPTLLQSVEGVGNVNGVLPADASGDVGPHHFVQWVNLSFAVYSKGDATTPPALLYGPSSANSLWAGFGGPCETRNDGDPIVRYDHMADRWVMSQLAVPNSFFGLLFGPFYECIAVSATPDPLGSYYRYQFAFDKLNDYPKFGVWPDGYYMTMNQFTSLSLQFAGQGVVAFERDKMLAGLPAAAIYYDLESVDATLGGMLPADLDGPAPPAGSPAYFVQVDDDAWGATPDQLQLWKFHVDWTTPASSFFTRVAQLPTAPFDSDMCGYSRNCIPQPGTAAKVDAISDRLMYRLQYRNFGTHESLVVNHTVDANGADHAGIRWYEIRSPGSVPVIHQQGTYAPDPDHRWMASAAMDKFGNIGVGFSISGAITSPSIRYTGRLGTDPPNTMTFGEADLMVGAGSQLHGSGRWGDYSTLIVDPVDDCTFWYTQQYYAVTSEAGWQTRIGAFAFPGCQGTSSSLPVVRVTATTSGATEAGLGNGLFTVTRSGDTALPMTLHYTVGGTAGPGADYVALSGSVTIAAGDASASIVVTPIDDVLAEPSETVIVAITPDPSYILGSSSATVTIVSDDVPPDLVVTQLTNPAIAGAGLGVTVTDTTRNQAAGQAGPSATGFYLSINTTIDAADTRLGSRAVPALAGVTSSSESTVLQLPAGMPTGAYYLLAKADADAAVPESVETNNTRMGSLVRVGPDLTISALTAPAAAAPGMSVTVSDTMKNIGGGGAGVSITSFYLSTNLVLDAADAFLGSRQAGSLGPAGTESASTVLTIPAGTPAAVYFVFAKADGDGAVAETQEGNNLKFTTSIAIGADLLTSSAVMPSIGGAGASFTIVETVKNNGTGPAAGSTTAFYLSVNAVLDASDVLLGTRAVPLLAGAGTHQATTALQIPAGTATGAYNVLVKVDANSDVAEVYETNNVVFRALRVGPDLIVTACVVPNPVAAGATVTASDTVKNTGGGAAPASFARFYLSTNISLDASDVLLGSRAVAALAAGASDAGQAALTIPSQTAAGTYYVIAVADADNAVGETVEGNNNRLTATRTTAAPVVVNGPAGGGAK
jgi:subtilase family serine protease